VQRVLLTTFHTPVDADLARTFLESHYVPCELRQDVLVTPAFGGTKLYVARGDFVRATELLKQHQNKAPREPSLEPPEERVARALRCSTVGFAIFPIGMHLLSVFLLLTSNYSALPPSSRHQYRKSMLINLLTIAVFTTFMFLLLTGRVSLPPPSAVRIPGLRW
jgi:hypothetical protein